MRTGDLGFLCAGELFVTGRLKDLIIIAGRNHAPHDIEAPVAGSHAALATDGCAAFGMDVENSEVLAVVAEVARGTGAGETQAIAQAIRRAVAEKHDLRAHTVQLIRAATLPRTSSGKVRRAACRDQLAAATLNALADGS